jgi:hypothetical protein
LELIVIEACTAVTAKMREASRQIFDEAIRRFIAATLQTGGSEAAKT